MQEGSGSDGLTYTTITTRTASPIGQVVTVLGPIHPSKVGNCLMHEHIIADVTVPFYKPPETEEDKRLTDQPLQLSNLHWVHYHVRKSKPNLVLDELPIAIQELKYFHEAGGTTIVEVTPVGIGRNVKALHEIATTLEKEGIPLNIVCGTSYYIDMTHPQELKTRSAHDIEEYFVREIVEGIEGTDIKAGIIGELGCSWPITENELKVLEAGARASRRTGVCVSVHPGRDPAAPLQIATLMKQFGADPARTVVDHIDRTLKNLEDMKTLAASGIVLEFDLFGMECSHYPFGGVMPSDAQRIDWIVGLVRAGYRDQIVVSHDVYSKHRLLTYGGHGYRHLILNIMPRMRTHGLTEEDIKAIFVDNPKRLLTVVPPSTAASE